MSTLNAPQSTSSNSTAPPSEATLADEIISQAELKAHKMAESKRSQQMPTAELSPSGSQRGQYGSIGLNSTDELSSPNTEKYTDAECALLAYSRTNKTNKLKCLLEAKLRNELSLNLNHKGTEKHNFSWGALHLACYFGHEQVVELLLSEKKFRDELDINIRNSSGDTPLHKAALTDRVRIVQLLLSNGANVFIKNCDGFLAKQLTKDKHILDMLEASEQADKNLLKQNMFKVVDNGDLRKLQEYFQDYDSLRDVPELGSIPDDSPNAEPTEQSFERPSTSHNSAFPSADFINQMTDERGNTLLHLAAMRGFKAICVYLLKQGFDPFKKNNLGQTCIELSSYQLRQLFMSVKPADNQLKRLSKARVTRFEGPLLRRVRILGWKQIYIVLENGVILLFNNRRDSMNRSRRGYKYLESAACEPDPSDLGMFTVRFSDNSRATFLVSPDHLNYYTSFKLSIDGSAKSSSSNQIELVRQKWLDSIRDHIVYSTDFIRKGLKFDDDDDFESMNYDGGSLANLNHLLPLDTIKSFVREARAHYSILHRHAESLCNLAQSISLANQRSLTSSFEAGASQQQASGQWTVQQQQPLAHLTSDSDNQSSVSTTTTSAGSRLFGFIRPNRQARASLVNEEDLASPSRNQSALVKNSLIRTRNNNATNEFVQDSWPCLLFHLRLLMESSENTKTSMSQALALMEHQEQLRQNRIQDQEERCRVLEDSLQALARDHHELEKSLSVSQIYQSACRSVSMSTDLNEYHDAFEDFDDEKTMTPNSLSSDEELDMRIQDVMNEEEQRLQEADKIRAEDLTDNDDEDLESNCSALTVETVTDQFMSVADAGQPNDQESMDRGGGQRAYVSSR